MVKDVVTQPLKILTAIGVKRRPARCCMSCSVRFECVVCRMFHVQSHDRVVIVSSSTQISRPSKPMKGKLFRRSCWVERYIYMKG